MFESGSYRSQPEHTALYEALDCENMEEFVEATSKPPLMSLAWKTSDIREAPSSSSKQKTVTQSEQPIDDVLIPDDAHISDSKDTGEANLPKIKTRPDWLKLANDNSNACKDPEENKLIRKIGDMGSFIKWYCKQIGKSKLNKADLEGPAFKVVKPSHKNNISLQFHMEECHMLFTDQIDLVNPEGNRFMPDVSKPLPLGGPPGQVTIQPQYFFNKDLEYLVSCDKDRRNALSISKLKAAYYPDFGLEELVPSLWIESEHEYDISAAYVRSHMRILSVVTLKTFLRYGYTYLKEIVLRRADYKEYKISEADFKNLHPNDFEDFWDASDFLFKEDYTIFHKPRAVIYRDRNNQKKMMRESEVHKFSDGTLKRILEKLDHMVKDFVLFKFNPGMENIIWSEDDKRRSKDFIEVIERRLKIRRIFKNLESFISGRLRDVDYRLIQRTE
ncbi:hypothetical protein Tco_1093057 [Tanacetum coccineum]|uniref:Uncharacterized protein n=1 Tax=Tanacetum coccineum TaxID=301880 RepID=A0ABQ5IBL9_9ASTR